MQIWGQPCPKQVLDKPEVHSETFIQINKSNNKRYTIVVMLSKMYNLEKGSITGKDDILTSSFIYLLMVRLKYNYLSFSIKYLEIIEVRAGIGF